MGAAIGLHAGTDAVVVALCGPPRTPELAGRWRLRLVDGAGHPELVQPYHAAAERLGIEAGRERITLCEDAARRAADAVVDSVLAELDAAGHTVSSAGLVLGGGRLAATLEEILRSHIQLHTAEGEMLRSALRQALQARRLPVTGIPERGLAGRIAAGARQSEDDVSRRLAGFGKQVGPPWTKRQQHACLVAWAALAGL